MCSSSGPFSPTIAAPAVRAVPPLASSGMFGVESFTAIINPPQAAIVAVSSIDRRPSYDENGEIVPGSFMKLTLSADHRIANGRDGALYMSEVKRVLENPVMLMV